MYSSLSSELARQHIALLLKQADIQRLANQARAARRRRRRPRAGLDPVTSRVTDRSAWRSPGQVGTEQRQVGRAQAVRGGLGLVPVGIEQRRPADRLQPGLLLLGQRQVGGAEVVGELLLVASADDDRRYRWPLQQPGKRDLGG